jgi:hypothetical protein
VDVTQFISWVFSSAFANMVVVGLMGASLVLAFGTLYLAINQRLAKTLIVNGLILAVIVLALSAAQFQCIPVSFNGVARLGLASFPSGPAPCTWTRAPLTHRSISGCSGAKNFTCLATTKEATALEQGQFFH